MTALVDRWGREIGNVRLSLTDRCNLRCQYCMPEEGIEWQNKQSLLTFEELHRIVSLFYELEVRKYRLTGGEPLLRSGIVEFVTSFKDKFTDTELSMTTNGIHLTRLAEPLYEAGLDRINISLDTLDHDKFEELTRRDRFGQVMAGIKTAIAQGYDEIKINAVSIKSFNDDIDSLIKFVDFSEEYGLEVRFIEIMPFTGNGWENDGFISSQELRQKLSRVEELQPLPMQNSASTSKTWALRDGKAKIGFISSVSESFCSTCNRLRITSDGKLRPCLHNGREYDLKTPMRQGASNDQLLEIINKGIQEKWQGHPDFLSLSYDNPVDDREMIRIGG